MKLKFSVKALKDLHRLKAFIAKKNPIAAVKYINRLRKVIRQLVAQPELGKAVEGEPLARELIAGDYIVRYAIRGEFVYILKIWHSKEE